MEIKYSFWNEGTQEDENFEFEPDEKKLKEYLVELLCKDLEKTLKSDYSDDGARQMANFIVFRIDDNESLEYYYEDEIKWHFESEAEEKFREELQDRKDYKDNESALNSYYNSIRF